MRRTTFSARRRRLASRSIGRLALATLAVAAFSVPAAPQYDFSDEPLLASAISDQKVELRGRWVRQWREENGPLVLLYNGGFRLDMGQRRLSANNAVVWIEPAVNAENGRKYYALTAYLSENAEVREPRGTITQDTILLVRGLRSSNDQQLTIY